MAKPKHGPALFDLLVEDEHEAAEALKVPRWWGNEERSASPAPGAGSSVSDSTPAVPSRDGASADQRRVELPSSGGPLVEVEGDQIRFSLGSVTLAAVIFVVLIALLGVFALGRRAGDGNGYARGFEAGRASYAADAMSEIEAARQQPPATELIGSLLTEPVTDSATPVAPVAGEQTGTVPVPEAKVAPATPWISGHTYVVAQEFSSGRREDAVKAKAFLSERGIDTALVERATGSMQLITTQGFDRDDPAQRLLSGDLLGRVRAVGVDYFAQRGGYRLEGYFKKLTGDTW